MLGALGNGKIPLIISRALRQRLESHQLRFVAPASDLKGFPPRLFSLTGLW